MLPAEQRSPCQERVILCQTRSNHLTVTPLGMGVCCGLARAVPLGVAATTDRMVHLQLPTEVKGRKW